MPAQKPARTASSTRRVGLSCDSRRLVETRSCPSRLSNATDSARKPTRCSCICLASFQPSLRRRCLARRALGVSAARRWGAAGAMLGWSSSKEDMSRRRHSRQLPQHTRHQRLLTPTMAGLRRQAGGSEQQGVKQSRLEGRADHSSANPTVQKQAHQYCWPASVNTCSSNSSGRSSILQRVLAEARAGYSGWRSGGGRQPGRWRRARAAASHRASARELRAFRGRHRDGLGGREPQERQENSQHVEHMSVGRRFAFKKPCAAQWASQFFTTAPRRGTPPRAHLQAQRGQRGGRWRSARAAAGRRQGVPCRMTSKHAEY